MIFRYSKRQCILYTLLGLCILQPLLFGWAAIETTFQYPLQNQYWRFISAHLTHVSLMHLLTNVMAWVILHQLLRIHAITLLVTILTACAGINIMLVYLQIPEYAGLSGILYAYLGCMAGLWFKSGHRAQACLCIVGVVLYATLVSPISNIHADSGFKPLLEAHLIGLACGLLVACFTQVHHNPVRPMPDTA